jgi:peptidylprolyl isomerase
VPLRRLLAVLSIAALGLAACGETNGSDETSPQDATTEAEVEDGFTDTDTDLPEADEPGESTGATVSDDPAGVTVEGDLGSKPEISLPAGDPPAELVVYDLVEGDGDQAAPGDTVTTHYVGVSWLNDGEEFDASWDRGEPISFPLSNVIQGWQDGIPGMRVGGRRLLVIPPELGYGAQSPTPAIAPNDTLVFVIDLEAVG